MIQLARRRREDKADPEADARLRTAAARRQTLLGRSPHHPISTLSERLGLSEFETNVLWLTVAVEIERDLGELIAHANDDGRQAYVSPWLCLRLFANGRRERLERAVDLQADQPLRRRGLLVLAHRDVGQHSESLADLKPAPFLLPMALGTSGLGTGLASVATLTTPTLTLDEVVLSDPDRAKLLDFATTVAVTPALQNETCSPARYDFQRSYLFLLTGSAGAGKTLCIRGMAAAADRSLIEVDCAQLEALAPEDAAERIRLLFGFAGVTGHWLAFDNARTLLKPAGSGGEDRPDAPARTTVAAFAAALQRTPATVSITAESVDTVADPIAHRVFAQHELRTIVQRDIELCWQLHVPESVELDMSVNFRRLAEGFALTGRGVQNAINLALRRAGPNVLPQAELERAAAMQQSRGLGTLAKRSWLRRSRKDLMLPATLAQQVDEIIRTESVRETVLREWGLERRLQKGLGLTCLFDGEPGTGKTLTAEVIAAELGISLYTVNIANVVSKWLGETEKNLQRVFDDAKRNRCVLLFDEADTLFSKRTSVGHAMDRYANMEIGLLLQLVEDFRGLVILTTNLKATMDDAFMRRFAFKLNYPMPEADTRETIWRSLLPEEHTSADVDIEGIAASYQLSGGSIKSVVLRAAYQAKIQESDITDQMLRDAATLECRSMGLLVRETAPFIPSVRGR